MYYTVEWTQPEGATELHFATYQAAKAFFVCLIADCKPRIIVTKG